MSKNIEKKFIITFIAILLLNSQFFFIPQIVSPFFIGNSYHNKLLITLLCIIIFLFWFVENFKEIRFNKIDLLVVSYFLLTLLLLCIQLAISNESKLELIGNYYYNLVILLYFPLTSFMLKQHRNRDIIVNLIIFIGILYLLSTIIIYYFILNGIQVTKISSVTLVHYVNGALRLPQTSDFIGFSVLLMTIKMVEKKRDSLMVLLISLSMYVLLKISQVRMIFVTCLVFILYSLILLGIKKFNKLSKLIMCLFISLFFVFLFFRFELINVLIGEGQRSASVFYRFDVISFYATHFFDNLIFGFGYSNSVRDIYSITDIGLMGFIFKYGMIGFFWILFYFFILIKITKKKIITSNLIVIYLLITSISLSIFDPQRILYFPILLAMLNTIIRGNNHVEI